jgi:hypothetical protein
MMQAESRVGNMITLNQPVNVSATTLLNLRSPLRIAYLILINLVFLSDSKFTLPPCTAYIV